MDKEKIIQNYMKNLDISREEAEQLFEDDANDFIGEDGEEMQKNAKKTQHREKSTATRKKIIKERKIDPDKKHLFDMFRALAEGMELNEKITDVTTKTETEISFTYNNAVYTWKLTKHRAPKN